MFTDENSQKSFCSYPVTKATGIDLEKPSRGMQTLRFPFLPSPGMCVFHLSAVRTLLPFRAGQAASKFVFPDPAFSSSASPWLSWKPDFSLRNAGHSGLFVGLICLPIHPKLILSQHYLRPPWKPSWLSSEGVNLKPPPSPLLSWEMFESGRVRML